MKRLKSFALGIIDKDKKQIKYLDKFVIIDEVAADLILWRHADIQIHHWIIQICPALEMFIFKICEAENIDISSFGEDALEGIKYYTKSIARLNNPKLQSLFNVINRNDENINVRKLKGWIKLLKEKNYQVDINELKNA